MNPTDNPSQLRADEVWTRFVGMFGGDSVERKYGVKPPPEWVAMLSRLRKQEIDRGIRRLAYSGAKGVPTLPDFTRLCRSVGTDELDEGERPKALPNPDNFVGDDWSIVANHHLLSYVRRKLAEDPQRYGRPQTGSSNASEDFTGCVQRLVRAKNLWAADMRDLDGGSGVPVETQKSVWSGYLQAAEKEIAARMSA